MIISRLRAYGGRWEEWVRTSIHQRKLNIIPRKHQDKKVLSQGPEGDYEIHPALIDEAHRLQLIKP